MQVIQCKGFFLDFELILTKDRIKPYYNTESLPELQKTNQKKSNLTNYRCVGLGIRICFLKFGSGFSISKGRIQPLDPVPGQNRL